MRTGDRILLLRRVVRLSKPPRRWKAPQVPRGLLSEPRQRCALQTSAHLAYATRPSKSCAVTRQANLLPGEASPIPPISRARSPRRTFKGVLLTYETSVKSIFLRELITADPHGTAERRPPPAAAAAAQEVIEIDMDDKEAPAAPAPAAAVAAEKQQGAAAAGPSSALAGGRETCSVEQLALDYYAREGCGTAAARTVFILFLAPSAPLRYLPAASSQSNLTDG